ncbi:MAG: hypothetical protein PHD01_14275, partial [Geobacteraceae bacterium]|nr:hypothetical protein [Geobacteraceae bacterium]
EETEQPAVAVVEEAAPPETPEILQETPKKKPRKPRVPRKPKAVSAEVTDAGPAIPHEKSATSLPETFSAAIVHEIEPVKETSKSEIKTAEEVAPEKPKRKRAPRKKKEPVADEPDQKE